MIKVTVRLFATFRKGRFREQAIELKDGCTVGSIVDDLKIPRRELGIILVNGLSATEEDILCEGDTVSIFPMVGGG